jgi:methyl-accepting chemotaxis protein
MKNEELLLKPIRIRADGAMMATIALTFLATVIVGFVYHGVIFSLVVGLSSVLIPFVVYRSMPGSLASRLVMAGALVIQVSTQIQASHGNTEMHFGFFVVLAFLLTYRDWRPIVFAAGLIAIHHLACNFLQGANENVQVFHDGTDLSTVLVHAAYVVFESIILVVLAIELRREGIDAVTAGYLAERIANGELDNVIEINKTSVTNEVLHSMKRLQDMVNRFVAAQSDVAKKHAEGWIYEKIDNTQFLGIYGKMANEINELVATHVAVKMQVVDVVSRYAKGDFSVDMDRLPGDKVKVTNAIDAVKASLLAVSNEIKTMVDSGVQGDFSYRANANQFDFVFKEILASLNHFMDTCDQGFSDVERVSVALAAADLTQTITRDYPGTFGQVKAAVNSTVQNLKELIGDIKLATETINTVAREIASGNNDLSHRTEQQAASLEQTAASMDELTSTVQHNAENAKQANGLAGGASEIAGKGVTVVNQVVETMNEINASSHRIGDIISVIDDIAFQTNILALNAAVEAARAGEQGKGFAVVAIEVRNLAQRAAGAAGEIKRLIDDSVDKVSGGSKLVTNAGKTMEDIVVAIQQVTGIVAEISSASAEQSTGISQVNQAIGQMDNVTQQNAALVEQAAASAEALEEQSQQLSLLVSSFKVDGSARGGYKSTTQRTNVSNLKTYQPSVSKSEPVVNQISAEAIAGLDVALQKHAEWKVKLRTAINQRDTLDAVTISKDNCCDFGKWLHGDAHQQLGHLASYTECVGKHAAFHKEAGSIAGLINEQKYTEADQKLASESGFNQASSEVGSAIMRLKKDVAAQNTKSVAKTAPKAQAISSDWEEF